MFRVNEMTQERKSRLAEYNKQKVEASYFPVSKVALGESGRYAIVNMETGAKLSEVSKRYTIVKNQEIFEPFIKQFGYESIKRFYDYGNSKYYIMEIATGRKFNFGTDEQPDIIEETLFITNSYNKTKSFQFRLGAFRWVCSNGLYSGQAIVNYKKIHVGNIPVQKLVFQALLKYQDNSFDTWKQLREVKIDKDRKTSLIENLKIFDEADKEGKPIETNIKLNRDIKYTAKRRLEYNTNLVDNQENGWGLYNQINYAIDQVIRSKSQIERKITANRIMEKFLVDSLINKKESYGIYLN